MKIDEEWRLCIPLCPAEKENVNGYEPSDTVFFRTFLLFIAALVCVCFHFGQVGVIFGKVDKRLTTRLFSCGIGVMMGVNKIKMPFWMNCKDLMS